MKRIEAFRHLMKIDNIVIKVEWGGITLPSDYLVKIYDYLSEDFPVDGPEPEKRVRIPKENVHKAKEPKARRKLDVGKMIALRNAGWTYAKIADEMGCATQTVINYIGREAER